ncbi:MAG: MCP four helix bundle domain-containing protein [Desulfosarcina sp.]|nr:MCP four helix bundle domain-containing protein [Desulfobacterales bacterium]
MSMWNRIVLRKRIYMVLASLVLITFMGGLVMIWYTYRIEVLITTVTDKNMVALETAEDLQIALANQKGFVSYYFLDGNPDWLRQLLEYRRRFKRKLNEAQSLATTPEQQDTIGRIADEYRQYVEAREEVIRLYKTGKSEAGAILHEEVRDRFFTILDLCEKFKTINVRNIIEARQKSRAEAVKLRSIAGIAILANFILALFLATIVVKEILGPIRGLIQAVTREEVVTNKESIINVLSHRVYALLENMDYTQSELEKSRENLLQAKKLAVVGKLAAGMAHSIRNPFTSVKMRLFSLERALELSVSQQEDFDVISEEIRHIDTIVQNFLEFSRPPKLVMQRISPSSVVDMTIQLLSHRLKSYDVKVKIIRGAPLPRIEADPDQLKEVLVNIVINACEAMARGGAITIEESVSRWPNAGRKAVIQVSDNGPGIPASLRGKVFEPFFTTKEEGTGLGMSIAKRIINEHQGGLDITSREGGGVTIIITLPVKESADE